MQRMHPIILSEGIIRPASEQALKVEKEESLKLAAERERHKPFFAKSYNPKVQVPYIVPQGVCPREIVIAGLKKEYAEVKIENVLSAAGITTEDIMPSSTKFDYDVVRHNQVRGADKVVEDKFLPFLPLEMFDDTDFDCYTPREWIKLGQQYGEQKPVPAFAYLPVTREKVAGRNVKYEWMRVGAIDYDEEREEYLVKRFEAGAESILGGIVNRFTDEYWVPRLRLMFMAEDPRKFVKRIQHALKLREESESVLRYSFFIDCMPCDLLSPPDEETINRILCKTASAEGRYGVVIPKVIPDIVKVYNYSTNERIFRTIVNKHQNIFTYVQFPAKKLQQAPKQGYKFEEEVAFNNLRLQFCARTFLTKEEIITSLVGIIAELLKVEELNLLHVGGGKALRLEDYIKSQDDSLWHVSTYVHDTMLKNLRHVIRLALTNCTTGWYNIYEKNWYVYESSKMKKFMKMIHYRIQDSLRFMVERGLHAFSNSIVDLCKPSMNIEEGYEWSDFKCDYFRPSGEPQIMLHLLIEKGQVCYSSDLHETIDKIEYIFNRGIETIAKVPQLERFILEDLFWGEVSMLGCIAMNEDHISKWRSVMRSALESTLIPMEMYCQLFERFVDLASIDVFEFLKDYEERGKTSAEIKEDIAYYYKKYEELARVLPKENVICIFSINLDDTRRALMSKCKSIAQNLEMLFTKHLRVPIDEICREYSGIYDRLKDTPGCIEDIVEMRIWMEDVPCIVQEISEKARGIYEAYDTLDEFFFNLPDEDFAQKWEAIGYPYKIHKQLNALYEQFVTEEENFRNILVKDEETLKTSLDALTLNIAQLPAYTDITKANEIANDIRRIQQQLKECNDKAKKYNHREKLFEMPQTDYSQIRLLYEEFEPYRKLWLSAADWQKWYDSWLHDPIEQVDVESLERNTTEVSSRIRQAAKAFTDIPGVLKVSEEIIQEIENFKKQMAFVQNICHPGMKDRHWEEISHEVSLQVQPKIMALTVSKCFDMGLEKHEGIISKIADKARKEYNIEKALDRMEEEWRPVVFDFLPYKTEGAYVISVSDECLQLLDDHIASTETIAAMPTKWFEERINRWEKSLLTCQATLGSLMQCQDSWLQLEPIFSSKDITRQLPTESISYKSVDWTWQKIMLRCKENPKVLAFCDDEKLLKQLQDSSQIFESLYKCLINYLELKRSSFPRLYFLSDEELFQIISQAHEPTAIQPHLNRCFQNIAELRFTEHRITAMCSSEGEEILFRQEFYPKANVEEWLFELECIMKTTLNSLIRDAMEDYPKNKYFDWILVWPGQVVILITQIIWTKLTGEALVSGKVFSVYDSIIEQLDLLQELTQKEVPVLNHHTLSSLIITLIHIRDIINSLRELGNPISNDFAWISQIRHYNTQTGIKVRIMNSEFKYEYEYIGNSGRLAFTPLTERCYIGLSNSLHLGYGCVVAGASGTGKTETIKDLAKAIAVYCIIFSCSNHIELPIMMNFFKGIACTGVWLCLYRFHTVEMEISSVIAQNVRALQNAWQSKLDQIVLEGTSLNLKSRCSIFLTMDSNHMQKGNLSTNLKVLFRSVSMMIPNCEMIAEILLLSYGFLSASLAARKVAVAFKLFSQYLGAKNHYDFGIRSMKAALMVAVTMKITQTDVDEASILAKAIANVVLPRLLSEDHYLFFETLSSIFPKSISRKAETSHSDLKASIINACKTENLISTEDFVSKCLQLYETINIFNGIVLIGPAASGKTKCYTVLKTALMNTLSEDDKTMTVHTFVVNPKSVTVGQLFGMYNSATNEWNDGLFPALLREGASSKDKDARWYIFDGPIDSFWMEDMNSILSDSKILCLSNGGRIKLAEKQTVIFELDNLNDASPSIVGCCGIVFMEPSVVGLQAIFDSWLQTIADIIKPHASHLRENFATFFLPSLQVVLPYQEYIPTSDRNLTLSLSKLLDSLILPFVGKEADKMLPSNTFKEIVAMLIQPWFIFSLIWSVGAICNESGKEVFSDWLRKQMEKEGTKWVIPSNGLVYDYKIDDEPIRKWLFEGSYEIYGEFKLSSKIQWIHWKEAMPSIQIPEKSSIISTAVPTLNSFRLEYLMRSLLLANYPVLCIGSYASGKSSAIQELLSKKMPENYITEVITFTTQITALQTQDAVERKLDRRKRGIFGPPRGKELVFFIDDFNMPALRKEQSQPLELLRQWMDFQGWYDQKAVGSFRYIIDVCFVGAMSPPAGGQYFINDRILRHFNMLTFPEMDDVTKEYICGKFLYEWIGKRRDFRAYAPQLIVSTIEIQKKITSTLLPVPSKCHYIFNLRDLLRVFQGMFMARIENIQDTNCLLRLWIHENYRVFRDRLVNDEDCMWFDKLMKERIEKDFKVSYHEVVRKQPLLFADFVVSTTREKEYQEIPSLQELKDVVETYMYDYNEISSAPLNLIMFEYALNHICRLCRILSHNQGNVLLLGVHGSGRRSLASLAAYISNLTCSEIRPSRNYGVPEWKDDLKRVLTETGIENKPVAFFFSESKVKNEIFLEDINTLLTSRDVQNLLEAEDMEKMHRDLKPVLILSGISITKANIYSAFISRVRANLHILISLNPLGEIFRRRIRDFPAFISCCTIDWFQEWPKSAFEAVATGLFEKSPEEIIDERNIKNVITVMQEIHHSTIILASEYSNELSRCIYVTRANYIELANTFIQLFRERRKTLQRKVNTIKQALNKLNQESTEVSKLQEMCEKIKPHLSQTIDLIEEKSNEIKSNTEMVDTSKALVEKTKIAARDAKARADHLQNDVQKDLNVALLGLEAAFEALKALSKEEFVELCNVSEPEYEMKMVMETLCIMFNIAPNLIASEARDTVIEDYWSPGMNLLNEPDKLLHDIFSYDKESISEEIIEKITPFIDNPRFTPDSVAKVSNICTVLCRWVQAIFKYHFVSQVVAPKREHLMEAQKFLKEKTDAFDKAMHELTQAEETSKKLLEELNNLTKTKHELHSKLASCEERLSRASSMFDRLAEHQIAWHKAGDEYNNLTENLIGDVIICAGFIVYLGCFTMEYRKKVSDVWLKSLTKHGISHSGKSFIEILGDPMQIKQWQIAGLPTDDFSTESALISAFSLRWSLFIDPQEQAEEWIRKMEEESDLQCLKLTDNDFVDTLCAKIRFGKPCLLQDVEEELDLILEPLLLKEVFVKEGSTVLKIRDLLIPYDEHFRFYITTKLPNPQYGPRTFGRVNVINFNLSPQGLKNNFLSLVIEEERKDLEEAKRHLILSAAAMKAELENLKTKIIDGFINAKGGAIDNIEMLSSLEVSNTKCHELEYKISGTQETEASIDSVITQYSPVAERAYILYSCLLSLRSLSPMYVFTISWFRKIVLSSIAAAETDEYVEKRSVNIIRRLTQNLYMEACCSLFYRHKLLLSFLICCSILMNNGAIKKKQWSDFLHSEKATSDVRNPLATWLPSEIWNDICRLSENPVFKDLRKNVIDNELEFQIYFHSPYPERDDLPGKWKEELTEFEKLILIKCLRPDSLYHAIEMFVTNNLGKEFTEPQQKEIADLHIEATATVPIVLIYEGLDPSYKLNEFIRKNEHESKLVFASLISQKGLKFETAFDAATAYGNWLVYENCHLFRDQMPQLHRMIEGLHPDRVNPEFRLWLITMPSDNIPAAILHRAVKVTMEKPHGIKAHMLTAYSNFDDDFLESCEGKDTIFKPLLLSLSLFHAVISERCRFGTFGFNTPYEFMDDDLKICYEQLSTIVKTYEEIPYEILKYIIGEINYGGRIIDKWDLRCLVTILQDYFNPNVLSREYKFGGDFHQLPETTQEGYLEYFRHLPVIDASGIFGMPEIAVSMFSEGLASGILKELYSLEVKTFVEKKQLDEEVAEIRAKKILTALPQPFDEEHILALHPISGSEYLNAVLFHEVQRYNRLLSTMHKSLKELLKALTGVVKMSDTLEHMVECLSKNTLPKLWYLKAYPSLKSLGSWYVDLLTRLKFIKSWIQSGTPSTFWINAFYSPQALMAALKLNFSREAGVSVDIVDFVFEILDITENEVTDSPDRGGLIYGLYLEGARWDGTYLAECSSKVTYTKMPVIWLYPKEAKKDDIRTYYNCPVYRTALRTDNFKAVGMPRNYIFTIDLPCALSESYWIKRGVALLCDPDR